jgi:hypothetical protein
LRLTAVGAVGITGLALYRRHIEQVTCLGDVLGAPDQHVERRRAAALDMRQGARDRAVLCDIQGDLMHGGRARFHQLLGQRAEAVSAPCGD